MNNICYLTFIGIHIQQLKYKSDIQKSPRRGIELRSPAWQAGILTTILSRMRYTNLLVHIYIPDIWYRRFKCHRCGWVLKLAVYNLKDQSPPFLSPNSSPWASVISLSLEFNIKDMNLIFEYNSFELIFLTSFRKVFSCYWTNRHVWANPLYLSRDKNNKTGFRPVSWQQQG